MRSTILLNKIINRVTHLNSNNMEQINLLWANNLDFNKTTLLNNNMDNRRHNSSTLHNNNNMEQLDLLWANNKAFLLNNSMDNNREDNNRMEDNNTHLETISVVIKTR
jgi:hypothetical protein